MKRCPSCHVRIPYERDVLKCQRCGMDLRVLFEIQAQARRSLAYALRYLYQDNQVGARVLARHAIRLHDTTLSRVILQFVEHNIKNIA